MIRKILVIAAAAAMPLGAITTAVVAAGPAGAVANDSGHIVCTGNNTASLVPPFEFGGTVVTSSVTTLSASASKCSGNVKTTLTGVKTPVTKIIKKYTTPTNVADCHNLGATTISAFTLNATWNDTTKSVVHITGGVPSGTGFKVTGTVFSGSFAGETISIQSNLSIADINAIGACSANPTDVDVALLHLANTISIPGI